NTDGLCGNEDCGQMSAWYIFSAMGFYPVCPGQDIYAIGTPLFKKVIIQLENGNEFVIKAQNVSKENFYIQSATLNGKPYSKSYISHYDIMNGSELVFKMDSVANKKWGTSKQDIPFSAITDNLILPVPYVDSGKRSFTDSTEVELASITDGAKIYYTLDGTEPTIKSKHYIKAVKLYESAIIKAFAFKKGLQQSHFITAEFNKIPKGKSIKLNTSYASQYSAGGDMALIDYIRGTENYRTGAWQGYYGVNLDAIVDIGGIKLITKISTGFLQDINSWIFMPYEVEYYVSKNGKDFQLIETIENDISQHQTGAVLKNFTSNFAIKTRYVKIIAKNIDICPNWHKGAGRKAWIFADEIVIE
ncbi:MAG: glycoside hydrolase family 92 protein, partial [Bacteroidales bacterium]|nr:glycoside hydrolase family 92 protein [Bacteroidales bacterium]